MFTGNWEISSRKNKHSMYRVFGAPLNYFILCSWSYFFGFQRAPKSIISLNPLLKKRSHSWDLVKNDHQVQKCYKNLTRWNLKGLAELADLSQELADLTQEFDSNIQQCSIAKSTVGLRILLAYLARMTCSLCAQHPSIIFSHL